MNQNAYMNALWSRIAKGKIGSTGQGYLDTGWLDSAFGGADAKRNLMLQRIGDQRDYANQRLGLQEKGLGLQGRGLDLYEKGIGLEGIRRDRSADLYEDTQREQSRDALTGDIITGFSLPLGYIEGRNQAKAIDERAESQKRINKRYEGLLG